MGLVVLRAPVDHINKAAEDPSSPEARNLNTLIQQGSLMHSGDQTCIVLGSDVQGENGNGKYTYDFKLQGVEGESSQSVSTTEFINERKKAILDVFAAGMINLGNENVGSHSLADSKTSLHAFFMERHTMFVKSVIDNDLIPQMAALNGVVLDEEDMPFFEPAALDEIDPAIFSAAIQRIGSVGLFPMKKEFILTTLEKVGLDIGTLEDISEEELLKTLTAFTSNSGEGQGTSGTGGSQVGGAGSSLNASNKA
jgi:hypothetical protein